MPIQYVGGVTSGRAGNTGTAAQSLTALTGGIDTQPREGDYVIVNVAVGTASGYAPANLLVSQLASQTLQSITTVTNYTYQQVSYKFVSSSGLTSITIPSSGNARNAQRWTVQVFRGVDSTNAPTFTTASGTASGRPNPPSVTPVQAGSWIVWLGASCAATGTAYTAPTDFATDWLGGTTADTYDCMQGAGYYTGWTSGSYDPAAITAGGTTGATDSWLATTVVLRPAPILAGIHERPGGAEAEKGYSAGGDTTFDSVRTTSIEACTISSETYSSVSATLAAARRSIAGLSAPNFGYWAGGNTGDTTYSTEIDGLAFSSLTAVNPSAVLTSSANGGPGTWSTAVGYVYQMGNKFTFSTQTAATTASTASLNFQGGGWSAENHSHLAGGGGATGVTYSSHNKYAFSTETGGQASGGLTEARNYVSGVAALGAGYIGTGRGYLDVWYASIDKFTESTGTMAKLAATASVSRWGPSSFYSATKGYWAGGRNSSSVIVGELDGITYSSDTAHNPSATMGARMRAAAVIAGVQSTVDTKDATITTNSQSGVVTEAATATATQDGETNPKCAEAATAVDTKDALNNTFAAAGVEGDPTGFAYAVGGESTANVTDKLTFRTDTHARISVALHYARSHSSAASSSLRGYVAGGSYLGTAQSWFDGIIFASETKFDGGSVVVSRLHQAGTQSGTTGYYLGGLTVAGAGYSEIDGVTFSTHAYYNPSSALSVARGGAGSCVQNTTHAYVLGGQTASSTRSSEIDGIVFSTETLNNPSAVLPTLLADQSATSSSNIGYACGGIQDSDTGGTANIRSFTFATEAVGTPSATMTGTARWQSEGTQSAQAGYITGGYSGSVHSYVDKLAFATVSVNSVGALLAARYKHVQVQTPSEGLGLRDIPDGIVGQPVDRTETASSAHSDNVFIGRDGEGSSVDPLAGTSGYMVGGSSTSGQYAEALRFATETTASLGFTATVPDHGLGFAWSSAAGYYAGGCQIGTDSVTNALRNLRFDDETTTILSAVLSQYRFRLVGLSSDSKGYFCGGLYYFAGYDPEWTTDIDGVVFSSETAFNPAAVVVSGDEAYNMAGASIDKKGYLLGDTAVRYVDFTNDTLNNASGTLADSIVGPRNSAAFGKNAYLFGGWNSGRTTRQSAIAKYRTANSAYASMSVALPAARSGTSSVFSLENAFICGGLSESDQSVAKFDSKTETASNIAGTLQVVRADTFGGMQNLATKTQDGKTKAVPYYPYLTEATGGTADATDGEVSNTSQSADKTETATAAHTDAVLAAFVTTQTDSGSALDTKTVLAAFVAAHAQAGTAADAPNATWITAATTTQAGASTDTPSSVQAMMNAATEAGSAQDTKTVLAAFVAAQTDAASGVDAPAAVAQFLVDTAQAGSATDTPSFGTATARDVTETATAADSHNALAQFVATIAQAGSAGAVQDVLRTLYAAQTDAAAADSLQTVLAAFVAAQTDSAGAADAATVAAAFVSAISEAGAALAVQDFLAAVAVAHDATASVGDLQSVLAAFVGALTEPAAGAEQAAAAWTALVSETEAGSADSTQAALAQFVATIANPAAADDTKAVTTAMPVAGAAPASATDTHDASQYSIYVVSRDEPTSATEAEDAAAVLVATFTDPASATDTQDGERNNLTIPASRDEAASASEVGSATAAFVTAQAEAVASAELASALVAFVSSAAESGAAVDTAAGTFVVAGANSETSAATALQVAQLEQSAAFAAPLSADSTQSVLAVLFADRAEPAVAGEQVTASAVFYVMGDEALFADALANGVTTLEAWVAEAANALAAAAGDTFANLYEQIIRVFVKGATNKTFVLTAVPEALAKSEKLSALVATETPTILVKTAETKAVSETSGSDAYVND